jgi:hypothetical protein
MIQMPDMAVEPYEQVRPHIEPGMVVFFSQDTSGPVGWFLHFDSWRIKHDQRPAHECTHTGIIDVVHGRRVVLEATTPCVRVGPLSGRVEGTVAPDGKWVDPYDGMLYVGRFAGCDGEAAAWDAWENMLLPYDYLDLLAIRLDIPRRNGQRYVCSELVAEALMAGGVRLPLPENGWAYTPADLALADNLMMLWRLR